MSHAKVAILTVHGMGETRSDYSEKLRNSLAQRLGADWSHIFFESVYYQNILHEIDDSYWNRLESFYNVDVWKGSIWSKFRKFLVAGLSDGAALGYQPERDASRYSRVQQVLLEGLLRCWEALGKRTGPVVILAQSLGGHVVSDFLWDAQREGGANFGVWKAGATTFESDDAEAFCRMTDVRILYTTGCNIPMFVAAFDDPQPFEKPCYDFRWINYFDLDDVLGWPLGPLSDAYRELVDDREINAKGSSMEERLLSATPFSHSQYWNTSGFLDDVENNVKSLLVPPQSAPLAASE